MNNTLKKVLISAILLFPSLTSSFAEAKDKDDDKLMFTQKLNDDYIWFDYKRGMFRAEAEKKHALISFCVDEDPFCVKLQEKTFSNPEVKMFMEEHFIPVKVNGKSEYRVDTYKYELEKDLIKKYEIEGYPTIAFVSPDGKNINGLVKGFTEPEKLMVIMKYISGNYFKKMTLDSFEKRELQAKKKISTKKN